MSVPKTPQFIGVLCVDVNDVLNAQASRSEHSARSRASSPSNSASRGMGGRSPRSKSSPPRERKSPARIADKGEGASNEKGGKDEQSPVTPDSYRALHDVKLSSRIESSKDIKLLHPTSGCNNISSSIRSYTPSLLAVTASPLGSAECVPNNNPSCSPTPINDAAPPQLFVKSLLPSRDDRASSASTCRSHRPTSASSCISKRAERTISCVLSKLHRYVAKLNNDAFDDMPPEEDIVPLGVFEGPISAIYARSVATFSSKEKFGSSYDVGGDAVEGGDRPPWELPQLQGTFSTSFSRPKLDINNANDMGIVNPVEPDDTHGVPKDVRNTITGASRCKLARGCMGDSKKAGAAQAPTIANTAKKPSVPVTFRRILHGGMSHSRRPKKF